VTTGWAWALAVTLVSPAAILAGPTEVPDGDIAGDRVHAPDERVDGPGTEGRDEASSSGHYEPWASGAVGAGVFAGELSAAVDLSLDLAGPRYAIGFGARLRWMRAEGFRDSEWDEISEWASLLRYLTYERESGEVRASFALGQLGGVVLGHGSVIDGYAAGIHVDHRRLGAGFRLEGSRLGVESLIDDLVSPRIVGARAYGYRWVDRVRLDAGLTGVADLVAPGVMPDGADGGAGGEPGQETVGFAVLDGSVRAYSADRRVSGGLYLDLVAGGAPGVSRTAAAGFHTGATGEAMIAGARVTLRSELQVGSDRYIGNWFGPLYERGRSHFQGSRSQLEVARAGGLGGPGGAVDAAIVHPRLGELQAAYRWRPGLGGLLHGRLGMPYLREIQGALWGAVESTGPRAGESGAISEPIIDPIMGGDRHNWIVAGEMRVRLPRQLFATAELSRLYRDDDGGGLPSVWTAMIGIGTRRAPYQ